MAKCMTGGWMLFSVYFLYVVSEHLIIELLLSEKGWSSLSTVE